MKPQSSQCAQRHGEIQRLFPCKNINDFIKNSDKIGNIFYQITYKYLKTGVI